MTKRIATHMMRLVPALAALLPIAACRYANNLNPKTEVMPSYSSFQSISPEAWDPVDVLVFDPWPSDSAEAKTTNYRMDLVARYSGRFPATRVPVCMAIENADGPLRTDTFMLNADATDGDWITHSKYGVKLITLTIDPDVHLTDGYRVSIWPILPADETQGLINMGITLTRK